MKEIKILCTLVAFGLAAANVQAQALNIYCPLNIELVCQVQQVPTDVVPTGNVVLDERATTTKLKINTKTLLAMIATDEGFTLPPNAKLWLASDVFYIFRQDNTIFTNVNSGLLNITYMTNVMDYRLFITTKRYVSNLTEPTTAIIAYNGSSVSFSLNCYGKVKFYNATDDSTNYILSTSYSGLGFGSGICAGQNMVITGSVAGEQTQRYKTGSGGNAGEFPPVYY